MGELVLRICSIFRMAVLNACLDYSSLTTNSSLTRSAILVNSACCYSFSCCCSKI